MGYVENNKLIKKLDLPQDLKDLAMSGSTNMRCVAVMDERATAELIDILSKDVHPRVRATIAKQGVNLDTFKNDYSDIVRCAVVEMGYELEHFEDDKSPVVRMCLVEQGYKLNKYISDEHLWVRSAVARQGYGLDALVKDENEAVRATVARQGYGLSELINDESPAVRAAVALQGYGLDTLINDDYDCVRRNVHIYLSRQSDIQKVSQLQEKNNLIGLEIITNDFQEAVIVSAQSNKITCKINGTDELRSYTCDELISNQDDKDVREVLRKYRDEHKADVSMDIANNKKAIGR